MTEVLKILRVEWRDKFPNIVPSSHKILDITIIMPIRNRYRIKVEINRLRNVIFAKLAYTNK